MQAGKVESGTASTGLGGDWANWAVSSSLLEPSAGGKPLGYSGPYGRLDLAQELLTIFSASMHEFSESGQRRCSKSKTTVIQ